MRSGVVCGNARRTRPATTSAVSTTGSDRSITPRMIVFPDRSASTPRSSPDCAVSIDTWSTAQSASSGRNEYPSGRSWMIAAYPKQMCTAVVPDPPSSAAFNAASPYARAASGRACMYGSSICTTSAPAACRSRISAFTAAA